MITFFISFFLEKKREMSVIRTIKVEQADVKITHEGVESLNLTPIICEHDDDCLLIKADNANSGISIGFDSYGNTIMNVNRATVVSDFSGDSVTMTINGKRVTFGNRDTGIDNWKTQEPKRRKKGTAKWTLPENVSFDIRRITASVSGSVNLIGAKLSKTVHVKVSSSGKVFFSQDNTFDEVFIDSSSSGKVDGNDCRTKFADFSASSSSVIHSFNVFDKGSLNASSSACIYSIYYPALRKEYMKKRESSCGKVELISF